MSRNRKIHRAGFILIVFVAVSFAVVYTDAADRKAGRGAAGDVSETGDSLIAGDVAKAGNSVNAGDKSKTGDPVYEATKFLHVTGEPQDVDIAAWRLEVTGGKIGNPLSLAYRDIEEMETASKKNVVLVCPGVFTDRADWEGVPLASLLLKARAAEDWSTIEFRSVDGFRSTLSRKEVEENFTILALRVNGVTLPKEHGFPLRLVAENVSGGKWVKWIERIEVK
jgi:sulfoxide reductase catalytic subunit YedY